MKLNWKVLVIGILILAYSIPAGLGGYLRLKGHRMIAEINGATEESISPEQGGALRRYRAMTQRAEGIKKAGRIILFIEGILCFLLLVLQKFSFSEYLTAFYGAWLTGVAITFPWGLGSAEVHQISYYADQLMIEVYTVPITAAAFLVYVFYRIYYARKGKQ